MNERDTASDDPQSQHMSAAPSGGPGAFPGSGTRFTPPSRPPVAPSGRPQASRPTPTVSAEYMRGSRFPGGVRVAKFLLGIAWVVAGLGLLFGIVLGASYSCESSSCEDSGGSRAMLFIIPPITGTLYALPIWGFGYALLWLDALERNGRRSDGSVAP